MPRSLGWIVAAVVAFASTRTVRADSIAEQFAHFNEVAVADVKDVAGYELPAKLYDTHVLVGRFTESGHDHAAVVLLRCDDKQCFGQREWLEPDSTVETLGVVDLRGGPDKLSARPVISPSRGATYTPLAGAHLKWPALVVRTSHSETITSGSPHGTATGTHQTDRLIVFSLAKADATIPKVFDEIEQDRYPTGGGQAIVFRLDRAAKGKPIGIVGAVTRLLDKWSGCLEPKSFDRRYLEHHHRYQPDTTPEPPTDCY